MAESTRTGGRKATEGVIAGRVALSVGKPPLREPEGFRWRTLTDIARIESGHTPSRKREEYWGGDIPWIGIRDATGNHGRVVNETIDSVTQMGIDNSSARVLPEGTVCLSRTASVGYVVEMGRPMATSQDFVSWVCGPELNARYLRYLLMLEQESVRRFAHGTTHQTMYYPEAKALTALLPSRPNQDAIAEVLGVLDDKIAANDKMTRLANALAASIFQEAYTGDLAQTTYGHAARIGGGGTPKTAVEEYWGGSISWATPTDVTALTAPYLWSTSRVVTEAGLDNCSSALHPPGSILMTSRATIGAFAFAEVATAVNQGFIVVNAVDPRAQWWIYHDMRSRVDEFVSHANGATFLELPRGRFKALPLDLPDAAALRAFNARVAPLHRSASQRTNETQKLAATRDALLPLLMSGRLTVKDAEKTVEEVL